MIEKFDGKYSFLSNFYEDKNFNGKTLEHYFQAMKASNKADYLKVLNEKTPEQAKKMGRKIAIRKDWDDIKLGVMLNLLIEKFKDLELQEKLLNTKNKFLVEGNFWHDNYWGSCNCESCHNEGQNNLGYLLMLVRSYYFSKKLITE